MTPAQNAATMQVQAAFLVALAEAGLTPDIGELLVQGNPSHGVAPGALAKALNAAMLSAAPAPATSEGQEGEQRVRIAVWNAAKQEGCSDEAGDRVVEAVVRESAALARAGGDGWRQVREIVDLWFSPWGAAKSEMWEDLSGDRAFTPNVALELIRDAIAAPDVGEG